MIYKLVGINGVLEVEKERLVLKKSWFLTRILNPARIKNYNILYEDLIDFKYKKGTHLSNGSLKLQLRDRSEEIRFKKVSNSQALEVYNFLKVRLQADPENPKINRSGAEEIREYKRLFDDGIITEKEFERKKREILNR